MFLLSKDKFFGYICISEQTNKEGINTLLDNKMEKVFAETENQGKLKLPPALENASEEFAIGFGFASD